MGAANSARSAPGRPFQPGQSGNPAGRPKGIARQLRDAINDDPTRVTDVFLAILDDESAKPADRIAAGREILDRAYGKAPTFAPIEGEDPLDLDVLMGIRGLVDGVSRANAGRTDGRASAAAAEDAPGGGAAHPELDQGRQAGAAAA